jgi:coenzyme F420 biosynthesis associated uncharacterized protein
MPPDERSPLRQGLTVGAAVAGAAFLWARVLARPLPTTERRLLDWEAVRRVALARTGEVEGTVVPGAAELGRRYDAMAAELAPLMAEVCGTPVDGFPAFSVVSRRGFIDSNLIIISRLFEPLERLRAQIPESPLTALTRTGASRYVGEIFGFLSRRVLGQYDPVLLVQGALPVEPGEQAPSTALYLVEPNVVLFGQRHRLPEDSLRRWLILHELTHAWQFEAHPWLRAHIGALLDELLMGQLVEQVTAQSTGARVRALGAPGLLRALPGSVRRQLRAVMRIQALMSVAEGYSNFVMHQVGARHLEDFETLEHAFAAHSTQRSLLERVVLAITGLNMKLRQYQLGESFANEVCRSGGLSLLNRVWEGPALMPTLAELRNPQAWMNRVSAC